MKVILKQSLGSHRRGDTINVDKGTARLLVASGRGIIEEASAPRTKPQPKAEQTPYQAGAEAPTIQATIPELNTPPNVASPTTEAPQPKALHADIPQGNLNAMLKADLVSIANSEGIKLDGSETKADLVTRIELRRRRYARRDMQASE